MKALMISLLMVVSLPALAQKAFVTDTIQTSAGKLEITFIGHGTLMFKFGDRIVHVDPVSREADYNRFPKADLILVTHEHGDHLDPKATEAIKTDHTTLIVTERCYEKINAGIVMKNGQIRSFGAITIEAVPAYNIVHKRDSGQPFHPKGEGNGYVITFGDKRVYVAGDTENTPEMKALKKIDIAFLPMNLPYTMTPEMVADAAKAFPPKILHPYHYGSTDPNQLIELLKTEKDIEVRIRSMK
ncbi:MAG: MBL fold metallo-hydrolase [candidate division KSB1 bacterium]|nr:MBL fold metallo-hydrolase [candidate division KSB1 bacterium]